MKKFIACIIICCMLIGLVGCGNRQMFDVTWTFNYDQT